MIAAIRRSVVISVVALALLSCSSDPNEPGEDTGVMYGTVIVYDQHLQPLNDMSGVVARYRDQDGNVFEGVTNASGVWEINAPLGMYLQDTIMHPSMMQLDPGGSSVAGTKEQISWIGKGRVEVMRGTTFCPDALGRVLEWSKGSVVLDSAYVLADTSVWGHHEPERFYLKLTVNVHEGPTNHSAFTCPYKCTLVLADNREIEMKITDVIDQGASGQLLKVTTPKLETAWNSFVGARFKMEASPFITQRFFEQREDGRWSLSQRRIELQTESIEFYVMP